MLNKEVIKTQIRDGFVEAQYPGDWCLRGSNEGDEPYLVENAFRGKTDWRSLDSDFIDRCPGGLGSALHFFSDEAFRFYLPAYLIADLDGKLEFASPAFCLTYGLDDLSRNERINQRRLGERTWFEECRHRFSTFTQQEASAIAAYLQWRSQFEMENCVENAQRIDEALRNYWFERTGMQMT